MADIPLIDLRAQYRAIKADVDRAMQSVLDRGQFILGPEVELLERELAAFCGTRHAVALASGTDALELALRACGIGRGDEVVTTAFSFFATVEAILAVGATPVFADIDVSTYTVDSAAVEAALTPKTKAILPVHLYGHPCAMDRLMAIARARKLRVIEDCAQAIGAEFRGQRVGSFGDAGCLSFYPSKNLGAYGDGGMLVTNDASIADQVRLLREHGSRERYRHIAVGTNSRLDELQAAILRVKLPYLERWTDARRRLAERYRAAFTTHRLTDVRLPVEQPGCQHVYHLYSVRMPRRDAVQAALLQSGISTQVAYPSILPSQPALASLKLGRGQFPVAEALSRDILSLPIYPELNDASIERIVAAVANTLGHS